MRILNFLCKIPRTESSVEEATEIATSASDMSTVNTVPPADHTDAAASLPDCWNTMQYKNFLKKYDGLIARNKKLGCDHCAKCDSINIKGIRVSTEWKTAESKAQERLQPLCKHL